MKTLFSCLFFLLFPTFLISQTIHLTGRVLDIENNRPLAFVNITTPDRQHGTVSNIDGYFSLSLDKSDEQLIFSLIGYDQIQVAREGTKMDVKMTPKHYQFDEVVIVPGINPADILMKRVVANREKNSPENIEEYSCKIYDKLFYTFSPDTLIDSNQKKYSDTSLFKHLEDHHLFMAESVMKRSYKRKGKVHDEVIGNKVSGLKKPDFSMSSISLQPLSIYSSYLEVMDKNYVGPLINRSWSRYLFIIEDTIVDQQDTTIILSFRPKKGTNFEGLKGFLYIDKSTFGVERVLASNYHKGLYDFKINQRYTRQKEGIWFPNQYNLQMIFKEYNMIIKGESYFSDLDIAPAFKKGQFGHMALEIADNAHELPAIFWDTIRGRELNEKEVQTYQFNDSLGEAIKLDQKFEWMNSLITGRLPIGPVDLRLDKLMSFDNYEGFGLGAGVTTNDKVLKWASVGGYYRYGFKDKRHKFGGDLDIHPFVDKENNIRIAYSNDVETPGRMNFLNDKLPAVTSSYLNYLTDWKNEVEKFQISINSRVFEYGNVEVFGAKEIKSITSRYRFGVDVSDRIANTENQFEIAKVGLKFRYAFGEKFIEGFGTKMSLGTKAPMFWFNYTHAFSDVLDSDFGYNKLEAKVLKQFQSSVLGKFSFSFSAAWVYENIPFTELAIPDASFGEDFPLQADYSFQTMEYFEFTNQYFAQFFYTHRLWRWYSPWEFIRPEFTMSHGVGWGEMQEADLNDHLFRETKDMSKGFFESGLMINHLLRLNYEAYYINFGGGAFYRYGEYAHEETMDNLVFKFAMTIEL